MPAMSIKPTPLIARYYLLAAALLLALPSLMNMYAGHTGKLLVSSVKAELDPYFGRTVVYLFYHSGWGARGLILTRPFSAEQAQEVFGNLAHDIDPYFGGPVALSEHYVVEMKASAEGQKMREPLRVTPLEVFRENNPGQWDVILSGKDEGRFRIFAGYSGWGTFQLESEMRRGVWGVLDYDPMLYEAQPEKIWPMAIDRLLKRTDKDRGGA